MYTCPITTQFRQFLAGRPSICPNRLAQELTMDRVNLGKIIAGLRNIPTHRRGDFYRLMVRYGWSEQRLPDAVQT